MIADLIVSVYIRYIREPARCFRLPFVPLDIGLFWVTKFRGIDIIGFG